MSLFDFLKNKKEKDKAKEKKAEKVLASKKNDVAKAKEEVKSVATVTSKKGQKFSYTRVKEPHISEKATSMSENNKYTFKVYSSANKPEIKKSVEGIYGVDVLKVNVIKIPKKKRRMGRTEGFKKGHTKAVVTIGKGQKIEIF